MAGATLSHREAAPIVYAAWTKVHGRPPEGGQLAMTMAIASLETGYGRIGQFAQMAANGQYNWGNIERPRSADDSCPDGWAPGFDLKPVCFRVFPTDTEAAAEYVKQLTFPYGDARFQQRRAGTRDAMLAGSATDVARAMRTPTSVAYYGGNPGRTEEQKIADYATAIQNRLNQIAQAGIPIGPYNPGPEPSPSPQAPRPFPWALFAALAAVGAASTYALTRKGSLPPVRLPALRKA